MNYTDILVNEAMHRLPNSEVSLDLSPKDIEEVKLVADFMTRCCNCTKWNSKSCSQHFTVDHVREIRLDMKALTTGDFDCVLMGQFMANSATSTLTTKNRELKEKEKSYTSHFHQGKAICQKMFLFLHGIERKRLNNVTQAVKVHGVVPSVHGNTKHLPPKTLTLQSIEKFVKFLLNYVEQHGLLLPGRVPGYSRDYVKLLPSSVSKKGIWRTYCCAAQQVPKVQAVAYSTFCILWKTLLPLILLMKPMTDLCWTCQKNNPAIRELSRQREVCCVEGC